MSPTINIINEDKFVRALSGCGDKGYGIIDGKDFEILQYDTKPLDNYTPPPCFPDYCDFHNGIKVDTYEYFDKFPECCAKHKKLLQVNWFNKGKYEYIKTKIFDTVCYTQDCINKSIKNRSWYKEITDYIDYTIRSYGQLPIGYGPPPGIQIYFNSIESIISQAKGIPNNKKQKLLEYLDQEGTPSKLPSKNTDLNILIDTYKKWLSIFPFELPFFKNLKPYFSKHLPFIENISEPNLYDRLVRAKTVSKERLVKHLLDATIELITSINCSTQYTEGKLENISKLEIELILSSRNLELQALKYKTLDDRKQYTDVLKEWFNGEKKFIKEIAPHLNNIIPNTDWNKDGDSNPAINSHTADMISKVTTLLARYPKVQELYISANLKLNEGKYFRNILDDYRLVLELSMKAVLLSEKSMENQRPAINIFFSQKGKSVQHMNIFWQMIDFYCKYNNSNVKHNDAVNPSEIRFIVDLSNNCLIELLTA